MRVAVGVIQNAQGRFLITQRPHHTSHGGFWEFPGGKLQDGESAEAALIRELKEEINLDVQSSTFISEIVHDYEDKQVTLLVFQVKAYRGQPICRESQLDLRWVAGSDLSQYSFPKANHKLLKMLAE